jgi:DNA-binding NarL/FixJ family response regulator
MVSKTTKKYFPIRTKTSCQLKWSWTALYLNEGISKTCHRTTPTKLTPENFNDFLNKPKNKEALELMSKNLKNKQIAKLTGLHPNTITKIKKYKDIIDF